MIRPNAAILSLLFTMIASAAIAQTQPTPEQLEQMLAPLRPTTEHRDLARLAGRWTQEVTYVMGGPPMRVTAAGSKTPAGAILMSGETLEREAGTTQGRPDQTVVSVIHRRVT